MSLTQYQQIALDQFMQDASPEQLIAIDKVVDNLKALPHCIADDQDIMATKMTAKTLLDQGWRPSEVFGHLRWMEHFDSMVDEDVACAMLQQTRDSVRKRLGVA